MPLQQYTVSFFRPSFQDDHQISLPEAPSDAEGWLKACDVPSADVDAIEIRWRSPSEGRRNTIVWARCCVCSSWYGGAICVDLPSVCASCQETHAQCWACGKWVSRAELDWDRQHHGLCGGCSDNYGVCDSCGCWYNYDDGEDGLCPSCQEDKDSDDPYIHQHGYKPYLHFYGKAGDGTLYLGVELETDKYPDSNSRAQTAKELHAFDPDEELFHQQDDGSLDRGIEIVTMPCTLEYHKANFLWQKIIDVVKSNGGKSHDTDTCGLHIHFNTAFLGETAERVDLNSAKLVSIVNRFWRELVKFSRRNADSLASWARRYGAPELPNTAQKIKEMKGRNGCFSLRYHAVNIMNRHTIEIRLFQGTLVLETLLAALELVDFLARLVKKHTSRYIRKATWQELVSEMLKSKQYIYLPNYLKAKGLM